MVVPLAGGLQPCFRPAVGHVESLDGLGGGVGAFPAFHRGGEDGEGGGQHNHQDDQGVDEDGPASTSRRRGEAFFVLELSSPAL